LQVDAGRFFVHFVIPNLRLFSILESNGGGCRFCLRRFSAGLEAGHGLGHDLANGYERNGTDPSIHSGGGH
jgi:hypothetical protein